MNPYNSENDVVDEEATMKLSKEIDHEDDYNNTDDETASLSSKKSWEMSEQQQEEDEARPLKPITAALNVGNVFRTSVRKLQTLSAIKTRLGIDSAELQKREKRSDQQYRRRSMNLDDFLSANPQLFDDMVYDWDMPLFHEPPPPPSNKEESFNNQRTRRKSSIKAPMNMGILVSSKITGVHWPSSVEDLCEVTSVVGYDKSMLDSCFYNGYEIENFRWEKFVEDNPDDEWVITDDEEDYEEVIIEEIDDEYCEEEVVIVELPIQPLVSRRSSL